MALSAEGVETIKVLDSSQDAKFSEMEDSFPEFTKNARPFVLGGFAAYGNPSSFHNTYVKNMRKKCLQTALEDGIFSRFLKGMGKTHLGYKLEVLFDRVLHRHCGQAPVAETAHRDITPHTELQEGDYVFGGWVNLSNQEQFFMCKPGSHLDARDTKDASRSSSGFNTLSKECTQTEYKPFRKQFTVKPGHMVVFPQHILHEVIAKKSTHEQLRLFIGWRLTTSDTLIFQQDKVDAVNKLSVPRLPSGQIPPMYSSNHTSVFKHKAFNYISSGESVRGTLMDWLNESFVEKVKDKFTKGTMYKRHMLSLTDYNMRHGYEYSVEDTQVMLTLHSINKT
jgi:hypothetical protein